MKLYTRKGDKGTTLNYKGERVPKDDPRVIAVSLIDNLQAALDSVAVSCSENKISIIDRVQDTLWQVAGEISRAEIGGNVKASIDEKDILFLESMIDNYSVKLENFVRFRTEEAVRLNEARIRTRDIERYLTRFLRENSIRDEVYRYFNRLSDFLFALGVDASLDNLRKNK